MKQRTISAIIMLAITIPIIIVGGGIFATLICIMAILSYIDITKLKAFNDLPKIIKYIGGISFFIVLTSNYFFKIDNGISYYNLIIPTILLIVPSLFYKDDKYNTSKAFNLLGIVLFLGLAFNSLFYVRTNLNILIYLISIPILGDLFAMLTGILIGKHKLIEHVSPKKTIEGAIGGLIVSTAVALIIYHNLIGDITTAVVLITVLLGIVEQLGDLVFSKIKRDNDIKDFSKLIPGHGGILDRIDSILLVSLLFMMLKAFLI